MTTETDCATSKALSRSFEDEVCARIVYPAASLGANGIPVTALFPERLGAHDVVQREHRQPRQVSVGELVDRVIEAAVPLPEPLEVIFRVGGSPRTCSDDVPATL